MQLALSLASKCWNEIEAGVNFNSIFIRVCICIWFDWKEKDNKQSEIEYYEKKWNKTLTSFAGSW